MKNKIILVLFFIAIVFGACSTEKNPLNPAEKSSEEATSLKATESSNSNIIYDNSSISFDKNDSSKTATPSQIQAKQEDYHKRLDELTKNSVTEINVSYFDTQMQEKKLTINDAKLIKRWMDLIAEMDLEARAVEYASGRGFVLNFKTDDEIVSVGGFVLPYIYGDSNDNTMMYVRNYAELETKIEQLKKDTGIIQ